MILLKSKSFLLGLFTLLSVAYPFAVYYFSEDLSPSCLVWIIVALLLLRAILPFFRKNTLLSATEKNTIFISVWVALVMLLLYAWNSYLAPLLYPVVMSLSLALTMGFTLLYPPSMIERFARLLEPHLSVSGVRYTKKVTMAWTIFGLLNAGLAGITVIIGDRTLWTLYNGCISYILMGVLMASEYGIRKYYKAKNLMM